MNDSQYRPDARARYNILLEQIGEMQRITYRNDLENLTFAQEKNKAKQAEVSINNEVLREKMDLYFAELARVGEEIEKASGETSGNSPL